MVLRARDPEGVAGFSLPLGPTIPLLTIGLCGWLLWHTDPDKLIRGGIALAVGVPLYFLARWKR